MNIPVRACFCVFGFRTGHIVYVSARTKVSIFALPIFGTDYILVRVDSLAAVLSPAGYDVSCLG